MFSMCIGRNLIETMYFLIEKQALIELLKGFGIKKRLPLSISFMSSRHDRILPFFVSKVFNRTKLHEKGSRIIYILLLKKVITTL